MKTPKEYTTLVKQGQLTGEIIARCIYSVNKRAKNYRDKINEYRNSRFNQYSHRNIENAEEKMREYYDYKEELLLLYSPTVIHRQHIGKETKRVYSYEENYETLREEKKDFIKWENSYYNYKENQQIYFFDYETEKERYLYFLYYDIDSYGFHSPISEDSIINYPSLSIVDIDDNFETYGKKIEDLLSMPFVKKVLDLIASKDYVLLD